MNLSQIIRPRPGKIAIQIDTVDEITPQGLYIPVETAQSLHEKRPTQGYIVAIGSEDDESDDDLADPPVRGLKVGDKVIFNKFSGHKISYQPPTPAGQTKRPQPEAIVLLEVKDILATIVMSYEGDLKVKV